MCDCVCVFIGNGVIAPLNFRALHLNLTNWPPTFRGCLSLVCVHCVSVCSTILLYYCNINRNESSVCVIDNIMFSKQWKIP